MSKFKLGRRAVKHDSRRLKLGRYLLPALPAPPPSVDWTKGITDWGMMLNDTLGDCTIAGLGHAVQVWSVNTGGEITVPDSSILAAYEAFDGYNPSDPSSDQGGVEESVLDDFKAQGFAGQTLLLYADPDHTNTTEIQQSIYLFGGVYIGMNVPNFIMNDVPAVWDVTPDDGGIDGGHCVFVCGYDAQGVTFISWGKVYKMTWAYWAQYVDEAHALLCPAWITAKGSPGGFALLQLQQDMAAIR